MGWIEIEVEVMVRGCLLTVMYQESQGFGCYHYRYVRFSFCHFLPILLVFELSENFKTLDRLALDWKSSAFIFILGRPLCSSFPCPYHIFCISC